MSHQCSPFEHCRQCMGQVQAMFQWNPLQYWGGVTVELAVAGNWFVDARTDNSMLSCFNASNCLFWWLRQSFNLAISCKHFPRWEALLWAILARERVAYSSKQAVWVYVTPTYLPSQMTRSFIGLSNGGWDPGSYVVLWTDLLKSIGRDAKSSGGCGQRDLASTYVLLPFLNVCVLNLPQGQDGD